MTPNYRLSGSIPLNALYITYDIIEVSREKRNDYRLKNRISSMKKCFLPRLSPKKLLDQHSEALRTINDVLKTRTFPGFVSTFIFTTNASGVKRVS
jgi:hypothetical protein